MPRKPSKPKVPKGGKPPGNLSKSEVLAIVQPTQPRGVRPQRFTQDTPVATDVWYQYAASRGEPQELLLTPNRRVSVSELCIAVRTALDVAGYTPRVIYNQSHVLARLTFEELVRAILPLSMWWVDEIQTKDGSGQILRLLDEPPETLLTLLTDPAQTRRREDSEAARYSEMLLHMVRIVGYLGRGIPLEESWDSMRQAVDTVVGYYRDRVHEKIWAELENKGFSLQRAPLWRVFSNREAEGAIFDSRKTVKADSAHALFQISCANLRWAVVDSGIDATHPAFSRNPNGTEEERLRESRVGRTYDFTRLKSLMFGAFQDLDDAGAGNEDSAAGRSEFAAMDPEQRLAIKDALSSRVLTGQAIDWDLIEPVLRIRHKAGVYERPENPHGTHVAGILAGNWNTADSEALIGMCPDLQIYDIRVFGKDGGGDEFTILAALQFIRHINQHRDNAVVQGVNLSFSLVHVVESYACGATPVCEECTRMVGAGIVVVAAAGNRGYDKSSKDGFGSYSDISITDPGNSEDVITVGATHRQMPHKYGVSYFSSRGPTGDGRLKPDLVAPGEKITAPVPGDARAMLDGTSMAAPHVSGAAALLMARHRELVGQPRRIKEILCATATDLGRERSFQGAGLVDVLRALQSV